MLIRCTRQAEDLKPTQHGVVNGRHWRTLWDSRHGLYFMTLIHEEEPVPLTGMYVGSNPSADCSLWLAAVRANIDSPAHTVYAVGAMWLWLRIGTFLETTGRLIFCRYTLRVVNLVGDTVWLRNDDSRSQRLTNDEAIYRVGTKLCALTDAYIN